MDTTAQASAASGSTATWQRAALTRAWISEVAGKQKRRGPFTLRVRSCNVPIPTVSLARARPSADTGGCSPRLVCAQSSEDIYSALQLLLHWRKSLRRRGSRRPAARVRGLPACFKTQQGAGPASLLVSRGTITASLLQLTRDHPASLWHAARSRAAAPQCAAWLVFKPRLLRVCGGGSDRVANTHREFEKGVGAVPALPP